MDVYLLDWANLLLRWLHVITAIAWVGSSFYFVWLDNHLLKPQDPELQAKGVSGALWAVHGGGFYHPQKYLGAPRKLDSELHWFYWESYSTWLSGFALFTVMYLWNAATFLVDKSVHDWSGLAAGSAALGFLVVFWLVYDLICRTLGQRRHGDALVGAAVALVIVLATWAACQLFAGRAAFLLVGAMIATAMSANVFFWIIPGQRKVVAAMTAGLPVDPVHGQRGKQRSVHNTYFTLPVLVAMLSNHYGWLYQGHWNWLVLVLLMLAGALIRHFFVARHKAHVQGVSPPWGWAAAGIAPLLVLAVMLKPPAPAPQAAGAAPQAPPAFAQVQQVIQQRCLMCHNAQIQQKNVALHTPELVGRQALALYQQVVVLKLMPLNNATQMTDAERDLIRRWYGAGAPLQ
ncbi:MAG: urate hydroxylase PuuD [Rubrivivax sp.]|nr:urate hydroxylase PuuD [Rubrivivax sp.]